MKENFKPNFVPPEIEKISPTTEKGREYLAKFFEEYHKYLLTVCNDKLKARGYEGPVIYQMSEDIVASLYQTFMKSSAVPDMSQPKGRLKAFAVDCLNTEIKQYETYAGRGKRIPVYTLDSISSTDERQEEENKLYTQLSVPPNQPNQLAEKDNKKSIKEAVEVLQTTEPQLADLIRLELEDNTPNEIAEKIKRNIAYVKQNLAKAHQMLKGIISKKKPQAEA